MPRTKLPAVLLLCACAYAQAEEIKWDVKSKYGITAEGIGHAIADAKAHFEKRPNDQVVLYFAAGSYYLKSEATRKQPEPLREGARRRREADIRDGTIDLSGIKPGPEGRLIFRGAGMDKTTFVFSDDRDALGGSDIYRVTFEGMHMTRKDYTVSQGHVVEVSKGSLVLEIQKGFPTPADIFNPDSDQGRYLRRYTDSRTDPQLIVENNEQIGWKTATHVDGQRWKLELNQQNHTPNYAVGDLVGIKSKHGGQTFRLFGGSDFTFKQIKWTHKTRGVFRDRFQNIHIIDCVTERSPAINGQTPCLASPDGGPQINQPFEGPTGGHLVSGCRFYASGDDAIAMFNVTSGEIRDNYVSDAFARGILVANSENVVLKNNTLVRCPLQNTESHRAPQ